MLYRLRARPNLDPLSLGDATRVLYRNRRLSSIPLNLTLPHTSRRICGKSLVDLIETALLTTGTRIEHQDLHVSVRPAPVLDFRQIVAVLVHILFVLHQLVAQELLKVGAHALQSRHPVHHVASEVEAVEIVPHCHVERCGRCALLLKATDVQMIMSGTTISQPMDQPWVPVIGEDDRLVSTKHRIELAIRETMWMLAGRLKCHQVHYVDDANFEVGKMLTEEVNGGQSLERGNIAGAGHYYVRFGHLIIARPGPDTESNGTVLDGAIHVEPLQFRLLARDDHVHIMAAAQTMIGHREQTIRVRRPIDAGKLGLFVHHEINEAGSP